VLVGRMTSGFAIANSVARLVALRHRAVRLATVDPRRDGHVRWTACPPRRIRRATWSVPRSAGSPRSRATCALRSRSLPRRA